MNSICLLEKNRCTGCQSCSMICPHHCIEMREDEEGFLYPHINLEQCTDCGVCVKRCPILTPLEQSSYKQEAFGLILKDSQLLEKSASGGAFAGMACQILKEGGVVFGAAYNENLVVEHIGISSQDELHRLQGSKYVAGNVKDSFLQVRDLLRLEGWVQGWLHVKLIRRSLLEDNNISWVEGLDMWEDVLLSTKLFAHAQKISNVDKALYHYRCNPQSIVNNVGQKRLDEITGNAREIKSFLATQRLLPDLQDALSTMQTRIKASYVIFSPNRELRRNNIALYKELDPELYRLPCSFFGKIHIFCYLHRLHKICDFLIFLRNGR